MNAPMTLSPKWEVRYVEGGKSVELLGAYDDGATARRMMRGCPSAACVSYGGVVRDERGGTTERQSRLLRIAVSAAWGRRPRVEPPPVTEREPVEAEEVDEDVEEVDDETATSAEAIPEEVPAPPEAIFSACASSETPSAQVDREEALDAPAAVVAAELPEHVIAALVDDEPVADAGNSPDAGYQSPAEARESEPAAVVIPVAGEAPTAPVERPRRSRSSATSTKRRVARETSLSELIDALVAVTAQELDALLRRAVAERLAHLKSAVVGGAR